MFQNLRRDPLSRGQQRDAGWIAHDELAAYPPFGLRQRQAEFFCIKRILRTCHHFRLHIFLIQKAGRILLVTPPDFRKSADQPFHFLGPVTQAEYARQEINAVGGYYAFGRELMNGDSVFDFDTTKLSVHTLDIGLAGIEVYDILRDEYDIQIEFGDIGNILPDSGG